MLLILFALLAGAAAFLLFMFATVVDGTNTPFGSLSKPPFLPMIRVTLFPSNFSFRPCWVGGPDPPCSWMALQGT